MASGERSEAPTTAGAATAAAAYLCTVIFLRLSPIGGSGEGKIPRCDGCCAGGAGGCAGGVGGCAVGGSPPPHGQRRAERSPTAAGATQS